MKACGIDFGTTNSSAGIADEMETRLIALENNHITMPSAIFFDTKSDEIFYGRQAIHHYLMGQDGRFMRSLKRILGTDLMAYHTQMGRRVLKFDVILGYFLNAIKRKIDSAGGTSIEHVVMGRPVCFRTNDIEGDIRAENELRKIAADVGFKYIEFQYEPIAAAFAHEINMASENLACIVDIGGGTSDFTIIRLGPLLKNKHDRRDDILASTGIMIGGNDFDKALSISHFMPHLGKGSTYGPKNLTVPAAPFFELSQWSKINAAYTCKNRSEVEEIFMSSHEPKKYGRLLEVLNNNLGHRLLNTVEETKISLTHQENHQASLSFLKEKPDINITQDEFQTCIQKNISSIQTVLNECLIQAGLRAKDIDLIIFTGGSTEIPAIQRKIKSMFPAARVCDTDKLSSVGLGLTYDAGRRFGSVNQMPHS